MKKLVLFFAAAVAVSFASCGSKTAETTEVEPAVEEVAPAADDSTVVNSTVAVEEVAVEAPVVAE
ncbi:MAG: hypothetical protein LBN27_06375 [Prevotellaceae bacterium]|jgi:hypothetical protein|nr:hypothetical protein [Prevotellaceae bacterium]